KRGAPRSTWRRSAAGTALSTRVVQRPRSPSIPWRGTTVRSTGLVAVMPTVKPFTSRPSRCRTVSAPESGSSARTAWRRRAWTAPRWVTPGAMLGKIGSLVARVAEEAGSVVGLRFGTEEPCYTSEKVTHGLEIRNYGPRIAAETTSSAATGNATIAMTAPVARQSGQKIAMTAPVSKTSGADGASVVRFFMPAGWTMDTLPAPNHDEVGLVTV